MNLKRKMFGATLCLILPAATAAQQDRETPRTPDGQPDLQGVWTNSSQTPLVRPEEFGDKGFLTREEAQDVEQGWRDRYNLLAQPIDPELGPPTGGNADFGYNSFWWNPRDDAIEINGEYRTSIIVVDDPLTYTQPWSGEVAMNRKAAEERMYEYACHEGNYAFAGILAGARRQELEAELRPR